MVEPLLPQMRDAACNAVGPSRYVVSLATVPGQSIEGDAYVALILLPSRTNARSGIARLDLSHVVFATTETLAFPSVLTHPGKVVVIGREPVLLAEFMPDRTSHLSLFGNPGTTYQVQQARELGPQMVWENWLRVRLNRLEETFVPPPLTAQPLFIRAVELE